MDRSALIVDDSSIARNHIESILCDMEIGRIDKAGDGATALTLIETRKYDVVLLDWNMPRLSGMDVLKAIRNDPLSRRTQVIMITSEGLKENILTALRVGANDYIIKPFKPETLKNKVFNILQKSNSRDA